MTHSTRTLSLLAALALAACVPTDPNPDAGWQPYDPDADVAQDASDAGSGGGGDTGRVEGDAGSVDEDAGVEGDVGNDGADMGGEVDMGGGPVTCLPNRDGSITRAEVPLMSGLYATYRVATDAPVDTAGVEGEGGARDWDLSGQLPGDQLVIVEAQDPEGLWFSTDFPDADYVAPLSASSDLLGIFQITDDALLMLGVASPEDSFTATKLEYDPPVSVLSFPIQADSSWSTDASVSGSALGVPTFYSEDYSSQVDSMGTMKTPFGTFEGVMRVRTELERTVGFVTTRVRTYLYVAECFGTVATIVSQDNESDVEFDTASEVRRLAQ